MQGTTVFASKVFKKFLWELQLDNQKLLKISKYVLLTVFNIS